MSKAELLDQIAEATDGEALVMREYDDALMGLVRQAGGQLVALYDYRTCVKLLVDEGLSHEEAEEHLQFNVVDAYVGPHTPAFFYGVK
jgi:hypothetical protein